MTSWKQWENSIWQLNIRVEFWFENHCQLIVTSWRRVILGEFESCSTCQWFPPFHRTLFLIVPTGSHPEPLLASIFSAEERKDAAGSFGTMVSVCQTIRCSIPEVRKIHYLVQMSLQLDSVLKPLRLLTPCFCKFHFNIIFPSTLRYRKLSLHLTFSTKLLCSCIISNTRIMCPALLIFPFLIT
jgi:hypothetical protein